MRKLISTTLAIAMIATPMAASAQCFTMAEHAAVQVRTLQTEMMVATLSCRDVPGRNFIAEYNSFVKKHATGLRDQARALRTYFERRYGKPAAEQHLDRFVTGLANDISRRSMTAAYCDEAVTLFLDAEKVERAQMVRFASLRAVPTSSVEVCQASAPAPRR